MVYSGVACRYFDRWDGFSLFYCLADYETVRQGDQHYQLYDAEGNEIPTFENAPFGGRETPSLYSCK